MSSYVMVCSHVFGVVQFLEAEQIESYVQQINKSKEEESERRKTKKPASSTAATSAAPS